MVNISQTTFFDVYPYINLKERLIYTMFQQLCSHSSTLAWQHITVLTENKYESC